MGQNTLGALLRTKDTFKSRLPYKFKLLSRLPPLLIFLTNPCKEDWFKTHLAIQFRYCCGMTEWIGVPCMFWNYAKCLLKESMADNHICYNFLKCRACLIRGNPPSINKFKSTFPNELSDLFFDRKTLKFPPLFKEINFGLRKLPLWVIYQSLCNSS